MPMVPLANIIRMLGPSAGRLLQGGEMGGLAQTLNRGRSGIMAEGRPMIGQGPYGGVPNTATPPGMPVPSAGGGLPSPGMGSALVGMNPRTIGQMQGGTLAGQMLANGGAGGPGGVGGGFRPGKLDALSRMPDTMPNVDSQEMPQGGNELLPPLARANFQQPGQGGQLPSFARGPLPYSSDMGQGGGKLPVFASGMLPNIPLPQGGPPAAGGGGGGGGGGGPANVPLPPPRPAGLPGGPTDFGFQSNNMPVVMQPQGPMPGGGAIPPQLNFGNPDSQIDFARASAAAMQNPALFGLLGGN